MIEEIWKDVVGYEGLYEVSSHGQVRTHKEKKTWSSVHNTWRHWKQRVLKEKNKAGRDVRVSLWKNGKDKSFLVHRLVAFAFIPTIEGKDSINHIDGNPRNNRAENLEWCDHKENNNHAFDTGLMSSYSIVTYIVDMEEKEIHRFRSQSKASEYLGRNEKFIANRLRLNRGNKDREFEFFLDEAKAIARLEEL